MSERDDHLVAEGGPDLTAAEYALGVLDGPERRAAEARMQVDPSFAAEVDAWSARLAPLAEAAPEVAPPQALWARIERSLPSSGAGSSAANDNRALRFWRGLALGASGLAAASAAAVVVLLARPEPPAAEIATLTTPEGAAAAVVAFDPRTRTLLVSPAAGLQPGVHTPHLWLLEPGGGVRLVGAIDPTRRATHSLPPELARRAQDAAGVALSLEPRGRQPVDKPGGPVVASGDFTRL
jgi:anti-sigma-K factor RskA